MAFNAWRGLWISKHKDEFLDQLPCQYKVRFYIPYLGISKQYVCTNKGIDIKTHSSKVIASSSTFAWHN